MLIYPNDKSNVLYFQYKSLLGQTKRILKYDSTLLVVYHLFLLLFNNRMFINYVA